MFELPLPFCLPLISSAEPLLFESSSESSSDFFSVKYLLIFVSFQPFPCLSVMVVALGRLPIEN